MGAIIEATDESFEELVLQGSHPVIVDFWARWAADPGGPCQLLEAVLEELAEKYDGVVDVMKVEVEENPGLTKTFSIESVPTLAFFQRGRQPIGIVGYRSAAQLEEQLGLRALLRPRRPPADEQHPAAGSATASQLLDHVRQLGELRSAGLITDDEFVEMKRRVLAGQVP